MNYAGTLLRFATGVTLGFGVVAILRGLLKDKTRDLPDPFTAISNSTFAGDWTSTADTAYDYTWPATASWSPGEARSWQATAEILAEGPKKLRALLRARRECPLGS